MFVVTDLMELQDAKPDGNGKTIMSWLMLLVNTISTSLYPLYKFFNAWSETGEIDFAFVKDSLYKCFEFFVGSQLAESLLTTCGCLRKIKDTMDDAQDTLKEVKQNVHVDRSLCLHKDDRVYVGEGVRVFVPASVCMLRYVLYPHLVLVRAQVAEAVRENEIVSSIERGFADAIEMKERLDEVDNEEGEEDEDEEEEEEGKPGRKKRETRGVEEEKPEQKHERGQKDNKAVDIPQENSDQKSLFGMIATGAAIGAAAAAGAVAANRYASNRRREKDSR